MYDLGASIIAEHLPSISKALETFTSVFKINIK